MHPSFRIRPTGAPPAPSRHPAPRRDPRPAPKIPTQIPNPFALIAAAHLGPQRRFAGAFGRPGGVEGHMARLPQRSKGLAGVRGARGARRCTGSESRERGHRACREWPLCLCALKRPSPSIPATRAFPKTPNCAKSVSKAPEKRAAPSVVHTRRLRARFV